MKTATFVKLFVYLIVISFVLVGTLFIPRPATFPYRNVELGYPIHFVTLDFSNKQGTTMGGAPDYILERDKFSITTAWEEHTDTSWKNFLVSYLIVATIPVGIYKMHLMRKK
jgi:hypothetical protein